MNIFLWKISFFVSRTSFAGYKDNSKVTLGSYFLSYFMASFARCDFRLNFIT